MILKIAQRLNIVGFVENLKNGNVRIVCEAEEKIIDKFIEQIRISDDYIEVEEIEKKIENATGEFESFEVKVGELGFEMFQGYATSGIYFRGLGNKIDSVGEKVDGVKIEVKGVGEKVDGVGKKIDSMHTDINVKFDNLDVTYNQFGNRMESIEKP